MPHPPTSQRKRKAGARFPGRSSAPRRGPRIRPPRAWVREGRRRSESWPPRGRVGSRRLRAGAHRRVTAPIYATSSAGDCAYMLGLVEAIGVFVDEERRPLVPALPHVLSLDALEELEERGRAHREEHPEALADAESRIQRGRPVHLHLHVRDDRSAQGVHGPPPQLLLDGGDGRPARGLHARRRPAAPLSPARAQLWPPPRLARRLRGLHDRLPLRPVRDGRSSAEGAARPSSRAFHDCTRRLHEDHRGSSMPPPASTAAVDWALQVGHEAMPYKLRDEPLPVAWRRSTASPTGSSTRR